MIKRLSIIVLLIIALVLPMESAFAIPTNCIGGFADFFYGALKINGANASSGTDMRAKILGDIRGTYTTTASGRYGDAEIDNKFAVSGVAEGYEAPQNITFEVFANAQWTQALLNGSLHSFPYTCGSEYSLNMSVTVGCPDTDGDGVCNDVDNCPGVSNADQANADGDGLGDACDPCTDADDDAFCLEIDDCNDNNPNIKPNAVENCDGVDNDCDGQIDEGVTSTFYRDLDSDTYGNALSTQQACNAPAGYVANDDDCNDNDNAVYLGAPELADGKDNDCDGTIDEGTNAFDDDNDGFSENQGDCNDNDDTVYPGAPELGDGKDNDCDGQTDEGTPSSDDDHDGFSENQGDCNDNDPNIFPGAEESCDNVDNDCNPLTSDGIDELGYGEPTNCGTGECASVGVVTCITGLMVDTCEEGDPEAEVCDGLDNDCNGVPDNGALLNFFQDFDTDTYGNPIITQEACNAPSGYVANDDDCNDNNASIRPGAVEVCDLVDNDCDSQIDEGGVCEEECPDADGDTICDGIDVCPLDNQNDADDDGVCGNVDNCPAVSNPTQSNLDGDLSGDACDNDDDNDSINDTADNCPVIVNTDQTDSDGDGKGNVCDLCPADPLNDADFDDVCGNVDNCPNVFNPNQRDLDDDGIGSACDPDENITTYNVSITIYDGWTSIALPFKPIGVDNSEELGQAISDAGADCNVVMRFNGNTQLWEDDILGLPDPSFALSGTEGYFIHCDNQVEFGYEGTLWV